MNTASDIFALMPDDLIAEHLEHEGLNQALLDWLKARGVSTAALTSPWPVAATRVLFRRDGTFDRDPEGVTAFTFAVVDHRKIIDLAAWHPGTNRLGTWLGYGFALGQEQIHAAVSYAFGNALKIHPTPLQWLQAGRRGIVILDRSVAYAWLADVLRIEAADEAHARTLRAWLRPPRPLVRIVHGDWRAAA